MAEHAPLPGIEALAGLVGRARDRLKPRFQPRQKSFDPYAWLALLPGVEALAGLVGRARDRLKPRFQPRQKSFDPYAWLALLLVIPALLPLLAPGYFFKAHDARHTVFFLVEFDQVFRAGTLWPVWGPDLAVGFGYPLWLVYAPLPYVVGQAFHLLGLGLTEAVKATWALGFVLGALGTYRLARRWWGPAAGLVASVAFTYAPYHLVQIYVRAALAEFMALAWLPWAVLALVALWDAPGPRRAAVAALAVAALLMLHTVSVVTFVPLVAGLMLVLLARELWQTRTSPPGPLSPEERGSSASLPSQGGGRGVGRRASGHADRSWLRAVLWAAAGAALGGLLAVIFLAPMLLERSNIAEAQWVNATYDYRNHFVYPGQFLEPTWGFGYSVPGREDGMSFQLGLAILPLALIGALAAIMGRAALKPGKHPERSRGRAPGAVEGCGGGVQSQDAVLSKGRSASFDSGLSPSAQDAPLRDAGAGGGQYLAQRGVALFLAFASAIALFLMTPASVWFWDTLPLMALVQFPWRLLAIEVFTLALLAGAGTHWLVQRVRAGWPRRLITLGLALISLLVSLPYVQAQIVPIRPQDETPLAIIEFELEFSDMRGMTRWSERVPQNTDSPLIAQYLAGEPLRRAALVAGEGEILAQEAGPLTASARLRAATPVRLRFHTYYFPGWQATLDGQPVEIAPDPPNGLIGLDVPAGEHEVAVRFGPTPIRRGATVSSLAALLAVAALALWGTRPGRAKLAETGI